MYKSLIRPLLFRFDPEEIHHFTFRTVKAVNRIPGMSSLISTLYSCDDPALKSNHLGLHFRNPVGLAAGFDKDGKLYEELGNFGFGFIETGTVTPRPQPGNPKPRLFRLPQDNGLVNRMGFNNEGVDALVQRLRKRKNNDLIIGGNIGKNKDTPNEKAFEDYLICFEKLHEYVDYFVVNVSSPNTPNLRDLQEKGPLLEILNALQNKNRSLPQPRPILLKIAPDLTHGQLDDIVEIVELSGIAGVIATNTTISRQNLQTEDSTLGAIGAGGLSGKPVRQKSTEVIRYLRDRSDGQLFIIAVGGIFTGSDAIEKMEAGASLVQVYTGFIYEGPAMVRKICRDLVKLRQGLE